MTEQNQTATVPRRPSIPDFELQLIARIRKCTAELGWTEFGLARAADVSPGYANQILNGKVRGSVRALTFLATAAGLEWTDLVGIVRSCSEERGDARSQRRYFRARRAPRY